MTCFFVSCIATKQKYERSRSCNCTQRNLLPGQEKLRESSCFPLQNVRITVLNQIKGLSHLVLMPCQWPVVDAWDRKSNTFPGILSQTAAI